MAINESGALLWRGAPNSRSQEHNSSFMFYYSAASAIRKSFLGVSGQVIFMRQGGFKPCKRKS